MGFLSERPTVLGLGAFLVGMLFGWMALGWGLFPLQYTVDGATGVAGVACFEINETADPSEKATLNNISLLVTGQACPNYDATTNGATTGDTGIPVDADPVVGEDVVTEPPAGEAEVAPEEEGGSSLGTILILLLLVVAVVVLLYLRNQRNNLADEDEADSRPSWQEEIPDDMAAVGSTSDSDTIPIARFRTTYSLGHDTYDDSFSIENKAGDFLGECGVSIAESIGTDSPKNVAAFEVWLFDKNDIRTITKVVMSDHAFFDDALKAKLKPKGEPFLAKENETIVLETAALIINAEITDMQYGEGTAPPQSFFDSITIELSAWAKDEDVDGPDLEARAEKLMGDY